MFKRSKKVKSKAKINFLIKDQKDNYVADDIIEGEVIFNVLDKINSPKCLAVYFIGYEMTHWTTRSTGRSTTHDGFNKLFFFEKLLPKTSIGIGEHKISFKFVVPEHLQGNFKHENNAIRNFEIQALILQNRHRIDGCKSLFQMTGNPTREILTIKVLGSSFDNESIENDSYNTPVSASLLNKKFFLSKGTLNVNVTLQKRLFQTSEKIPIDIKVENTTSKKLTMRVKLIQSLGIISQGGKKINTHVLYKKTLINKIPKKYIEPKQNDNIEIELDLPDKLETSVIKCKSNDNPRILITYNLSIGFKNVHGSCDFNVLLITKEQFKVISNFEENHKVLIESNLDKKKIENDIKKEAEEKTEKLILKKRFNNLKKLKKKKSNPKSLMDHAETLNIKKKGTDKKELNTLKEMGLKDEKVEPVKVEIKKEENPKEENDKIVKETNDKNDVKIPNSEKNLKETKIENEETKLIKDEIIESVPNKEEIPKDEIKESKTKIVSEDQNESKKNEIVPEIKEKSIKDDMNETKEELSSKDENHNINQINNDNEENKLKEIETKADNENIQVKEEISTKDENNEINIKNEEKSLKDTETKIDNENTDEIIPIKEEETIKDDKNEIIQNVSEKPETDKVVNENKSNDKKEVKETKNENKDETKVIKDEIIEDKEEISTKDDFKDQKIDSTTKEKSTNDKNKDNIDIKENKNIKDKPNEERIPKSEEISVVENHQVENNDNIKDIKIETELNQKETIEATNKHAEENFIKDKSENIIEKDENKKSESNQKEIQQNGN